MPVSLSVATLCGGNIFIAMISKSYGIYDGGFGRR